MSHIGRVVAALSQESSCAGRGASGQRTGRDISRFLACRRGVAALESAFGAVVLVLCLVGIFEIVQAVFVGDLLQRAADRIAYANALRDNAAANLPELRTQFLESINAEVSGFLNFELADGEGTCTTTADFCLKIHISVYDNPTDMLNDTPSQGGNAGLGGDAGDMVVVTVVAVPQRTLSELQQRLFGTAGLEAVAVRRNERISA